MLKMLQGMIQSKTMWVGGGVTVLGILGWVQDHSALILALQPQLGPILAILGPIMIVLRVLTESTPAWKAPVEEVEVQRSASPGSESGNSLDARDNPLP